MESTVLRDEEAPLVPDGSPPPPSLPRNHSRDVHILSCGFLLVFSAYGAAQNLQSTLNSTDNLGTISLGILYVSFTFFSIVASLVVRGIGPKNAVILGTTGYWLFVAANLKPTWFTMVPASLYLGFTASIIWVGQGTYLTSIARSHAKDHNLHEGKVIGSFNGEFWMMFASHQFVGNLVSLALLNDDEVGSMSGTTLLFTVFLCSLTLGIILMCFMSLNFTKDVVKPALGESGVGGSMAVYGAADAICSLAAGPTYLRPHFNHLDCDWRGSPSSMCLCLAASYTQL
ncbi:hypothetical protein MLD38_026503 [Melastoma candidum]|uniref:Uncharacterized protein n=1 Tax=Melastoma candidum TaxID=119954 RepID=A0ACB9P5C2_9MYRT|nr:hypothetical protein MLD38_026503 [Melastoma candidum]